MSTVLSLLKTWSLAKELNMKLLTFKSVMLCMLVTGQRCQSVYLMDMKHLEKLVKQSRPGKAQPVLVLPAYPADRRLFVMTK